MENIHDVYWGGHGCKRRKGHAHPCLCACGVPLPALARQHVFGDDKDTAVFKPEPPLS